MTLDEAIAHAKEVADDMRQQIMSEPNKEIMQKCVECIDEHEQLAGWLEELKAYKDAEEQGLLLRLPCKVGDIVYHEKTHATIHTGIQAYQITNIMISQNKKGVWTKKYRAMLLLNGKIIDNQLNFSFDEIGKTVFLTKEEAEQLKGVEHNEKD